MASVPPGTRQRCALCQVEIQGLVGGLEQVHFSQGQPSTRSKLYARVCQDPSLRGETQPGDAYMEPPVADLGAMGA